MPIVVLTSLYISLASIYKVRKPSEELAGDEKELIMEVTDKMSWSSNP
jgi:hypothetical protein